MVWSRFTLGTAYEYKYSSITGNNMIGEISFHLSLKYSIHCRYVRPSHTKHKTAQIFLKKPLWKCWKNHCSCETKLLCVRKISAFFAFSCVACEDLNTVNISIILVIAWSRWVCSLFFNSTHHNFSYVS